MNNYNEPIKIKEVPVWAIFVFVASLVFSGGQLYAQQIENTKKIELIQETNAQEVKELRAALDELKGLERNAISERRVLSTKLINIQRMIEKLEERTEQRYD